MSVSLRPFSMNDLDELAKYANNRNISNFLMDAFPNPYSKQDGIDFIEKILKFEPARNFVIDFEGQFSGGIGIHPQEDIFKLNAELGYYVAEPFWGKGIATEAVKQMIIYGFENFDINRIFARPFGNNPASKRVLEKAGMSLEATFEKTIIKNDELLDELIYAIRK